MALTHISIPLFDAAVQLEEVYTDHKAQTLTIEQEEILAEDAYHKRQAMKEAVPTSWAINQASESRSPYNVVF
jgi:hypothetical protein